MIHLVSRHDVVESAVIHDSQTSEKSVCFLIEYSTANITLMPRVRKSGAILIMILILILILILIMILILIFYLHPINPHIKTISRI
jgi:hypothetical protein